MQISAQIGIPQWSQNSRTAIGIVRDACIVRICFFTMVETHTSVLGSFNWSRLQGQLYV